MDILKIATAGSVDDGKSTLIGRLLYETRSVPKDKLAAIEAASKRRGFEALDLSLLTDGLIAEREQGITIDVAHVYFGSERRRFIIADTPGHFEYTRNMVTGASQAAVSIILIDARNGVVEQTARHYFIAAMLRIPTVIVCVNKLDLVEYSQTRFAEVCADFQRLAERSRPDNQTIHYLPMAALHGENVTRRGEALRWYSGPTLLELLETADARSARQYPARLAVQTVIRPRVATDAHLHDYRGYAGRVASGQFAVGDEVVALPGGRRTRVTRIERFGRAYDVANAGDSVALQLADQIDAGRGHLLAHPDAAPRATQSLRAQVCWLDHTPAAAGKTYLLQSGVAAVRAKLDTVHDTVDVASLQRRSSPDGLNLNEIGTVTVRLAEPVYVDAYRNNPANGAFILIDEWSNTTAGVGVVLDE